MSYVEGKIANLKKQVKGYWSQRIIAQLEYAMNMSKVNNNEYDSIIEKAADFISNKINEDSVITKDASLEAEKMIMQLSPKAKKYKIICAAHAHIDMNWMWRWDETVAVALDTFRTMLDLMNEYLDFTFSQSQASVYRIVEEYAPDMLEEIKARIKEGRWEVTASTWVEADKNMPNGESHSRHLLYTKNYLSKLLDIDPASLNIDFEPDTFGHTQNVPEILSNGGVKYYYHCRGYDGHVLYRWYAPSGKHITVYREPIWYLGYIEPSLAMHVPELCHKYNMDTALKVYGVGDHGGGPTRRDIERIIDMNTWPVFPQLRFGTFKEFFALTDKVADKLPQVKQELNFMCTGCYTTQTRIKQANRIGEATLNEAEAFNAVSSLCNAYSYSSEEFAKAWENILFNQFHDIIPGSGIVDTREYARGLFQRAMAIANSRKASAMRSIASNIDTSKLVPEKEDIKDTTSEGAGVGYGITEFKAIQTERGRGKTRIFHIFNPSQTEREEPVELVIWDWNYDLKRLVFKDSNGNVVPHQLLDNGFNQYWFHSYIRVLIKASVPAMGYSTYTMTENDDYTLENPLPQDPRVEKINVFVLENDNIKATFDSKDASITSLIDKKTGEELIDTQRKAGVFRIIDEDESFGMTAWVVGRYMNVENITNDVRIKNVKYASTNLRQSISYEMEFRNSKLEVVVSLDYNSSNLDYKVKCDWHEIGKPGKGIPQLNFFMPVAYECASYKYDVPMGTIVREDLDMDVPGNSWALAMRKDQDKKSIMLVTDSKYGFRGHDNSIAITLIRSSFDPDPYPELGIHEFRFGICVVKDSSNRDLIQNAYNYNHPLSFVSDTSHTGSLPLTKSFIELADGSVAISAIKMPEVSEYQKDCNKLIVRVYETEGTKTTATLKFFKNIVTAYYVDILENPINTTNVIEINGNAVSFDVLPYSIANICLEF